MFSAHISLPNFSCPENMIPYLEKVFAGEYELPLVYNRKPPTILDLGANCGAFSIWASHRWPGARIYAFEPHPVALSYLEKNVRLYGGISVHKYAVGEAGIRVLLNGENNLGESSLYLPQNHMSFTGQHVEVTDPLSLPEADILKMDIEGCEIEVLRPLLEAGRSFDGVIFEYHRPEDRRTLDALLKDYYLTNSLVTKHGLGVAGYVHKRMLP